MQGLTSPHTPKTPQPRLSATKSVPEADHAVGPIPRIRMYGYPRPRRWYSVGGPAVWLREGGESSGGARGPKLRRPNLRVYPGVHRPREAWSTAR